MKQPRTEKTAVVIGRNRRVYARTFKMEKSIFAFAERYLKREAVKAHEEGFRAINMEFRQVDDLYRFDIKYAPEAGGVA